MISLFVRVSACAAIVCMPLSVMAADDELDEVVVTASLIESRLSATPASVSVLRADQLAVAGASNFGDVLGMVPNLGFAGGTSRPRFFQIRGIGELEQYEGAPNSSVGFLIDDIDFSGIAMPAALFDMKQAEVLRGPQGTAYGANAIAGLISMRSEAPHDGFELRGELEGGNYGTYGGGVVLNDSFGEDTAWRLALHRQVSDGFRRDAFLGRDDTNGFDENLARLRVVSHLTPTLDMNLTALISDADNGYDAWSIDNSRVTQSDYPGVDSQLSHALAVRLDYDGWKNLTLRSISTFAHSDMAYSYDGDWGNDAMWGMPYNYFELIDRTRRNFSQEFRLRSRGNDSGDWVAGVYALRMDEDYSIVDTSDGVAYRQLTSDYRALNLAAYGQVDRSLTAALSLSAGLRIERRGAHYLDSEQLRSNPVDVMEGGHLALTWQLATHRSAYASLTRGYKAGGINTTVADIPDDLRTFDPESLWNLESGLRMQSAGGRFDSQTSIFYMRRSHQQVSSSVQADPENPQDFVLLTDNAARGENLGLETQLGWRPVSSLRLGASLALLRARFLDYKPSEDRNLDGRETPHSPGYQLGLAVDWHDRQGLFAHADFQAVDGYYFSASHDERANAYQLLNLRAGYATDRWTASIYVRNALNERYAVRGFFFEDEPGVGNKRYIQNGDPRQIGLRVAFGF